MLNFIFLGKDQELVSQPHFMYNFSKKCFSSYILLTDRFIVWLSVPLEILDNMCIAIVY